MKLAIPKGYGQFHKFTNEGLKVGDEVFPLIHGWSDKGEFYLTSFDINSREDAFTVLAVTGWPSEPHTIKKIVKEEGEPLRIYTDKGYSPAEVYFKLIAKED